MPYVTIKEGTIGMVFKKDKFERFIEAGEHRVKYKETVRAYDLFSKFESPIHLGLLLKNKDVKEKLILVEVRENEIALQYEKGFLKAVLRTGIHSFWKGEVDYEFKVIDLTSTDEIIDLNKNMLHTSFLAPFVRQHVVEAFQKGLLFVDGEFVREIGPGTYIFWKNSVPITMSKVDTRQQQLEISGQEILTKDKAALRVNFYVHYQVADIKLAIMENKNFVDQLYMLMQFALREFIGTLSLDELLEKKDEIGTYILSNFKDKVKSLGVELFNAGIRDVILPGEVKEIMNQVLVAQKRAQANIITRREETASTRSLLNTAKIMEENSMLFKLKEMEYIEKIAEKIGEITVSGNGNAVEQLKEIFTPNKK
jgi:regulator of protease activity HflC (stomatin/prohibitin superfamily)